MDVINSGEKEVFQPLFKCVDRPKKKNKKDKNENYHKLECTDDHPLLTTDGWKELKDLQLVQSNRPGIGRDVKETQMFFMDSRPSFLAAASALESI